MNTEQNILLTTNASTNQEPECYVELPSIGESRRKSNEDEQAVHHVENLEHTASQSLATILIVAEM